MSMPKYTVHFVSIKSERIHIPEYTRIQLDKPCTIRKTSNVCQIVLGDHLNGENIALKNNPIGAI